IYDTPIGDLMRSRTQTEFGDAKLRSLPGQCRRCRYRFACNGECPRNRFATTREGEPGLNYLCKGYYKFFDHVAPYMDFMRNELAHRRPPSNVMEWARRRMASNR
ncbi:MAG: SPASM domain-containing protein, partial [Alistipes sp.]|nr:SPASM domain-containing protein [Alistipes sp.]